MTDLGRRVRTALLAVALLCVVGACEAHNPVQPPSTSSHPVASQELRITIPAYVDPGNSDYWESVIEAAPQVRDVILNPGNGPGSSIVNPYIALIGTLRHAGIRVLGYVSTGHGNRDPAVVTTEIEHWREWYGVDNIFLDEAAAVQEGVGTYANYAATVHEEGGIVVLNPGVIPHQEYFEFADAIVTFEDPMDAYLRIGELPEKARMEARADIWHIVIGAPQDRLNDIMRRARQYGADGIYVTDDVEPNPYDGLPTYWLGKLDVARQ